MKALKNLLIFLIVIGFKPSYSQITFNYTGGPQGYVIPAGVTVICFTVNGAQGNGNVLNQMNGGLGGRVIGSIAVVPGQSLQINVGGGGIASNVGGWNGGGNGGFVATNCCLTNRGGGGGGASDIRIGGTALGNRIAVGAGGGGTGGRRVQGCAPGCGGGGGGGYYGGGGGGAYGGSPGFGGSQVAGGNGGAACCGCPLAPQPGFVGALGNGGNGGGLNGCNNQAANNPGCIGGVGGALVGGQGPNCTGGTGCPSTWAGASGGGGSNFMSAAVIGPVHSAGVQAGNGQVIIIPNCCNQPTIVPIANPNPICSGQTVTLTATGAGIGGTYTWTPGPITGSMVTVTPTASTIYSVTGTNTMNCIGTQTILVTVSPSPTAFPGSNSPVCTGGTLNLTSNAANSYTWAGPNAFASNAQNPNINNVTTANSGNYTVTITGPTGCTANAVTSVTINPTPTITPGNTGPYCAGATINLTVTAGASYTWTGPNAFLSNLQNPTIVGSTTIDAGVYTVTVTANGGCTSTGNTTVVVFPSPSPTATSNSPICNGSALNFSGLGGTTYTWSGPGGFSSNQQNPVIAAATLTNAGNYTLSVTNANGCTNSVVTTVVVNALPVIAVNNPTTCLGANFTLTATGGTAFAWTGPNAFNSAQQNPGFTNATSNLSGSYTVFVTSALGCTNTAVANVSIVPLPTVSIVGTNTLCSQNFNGSTNTVALTASGATTFTWSAPAGYNISPNPNNPLVTITPSATALQEVATISITGSSGSCTSSIVYTLTVLPNPTITVSSGSMCAGTNVTLTANNANTYAWSPSSSLNSASGPLVIASPSVSTIYSVIGSSLGCNSQTQNGTVTVVANPTISIGPNTPTICIGNSILLNGMGATNYTWSPNIAITATTGANVTVNPNATMQYTLIGEQSTCTNVAVTTVTVVSLPVINVVTASPTLCMNGFNGSPNSVAVTAAGATTYTWFNFVGIAPNITTGANITATSILSSSIGVGSVIGSAATCTNVASFTVFAVPNPVIAVTSASMCFGTSAMISASGAGLFTWSPGASLNTTTGSSVIASPNITTIYSVVGSSLGCKSATETGTVIVVANPTLNINSVSAATICAGNPISLSGSGASTYTWLPGNTVDNMNNQNVIATPISTTNYTLIGTLNTCTASTIKQVTVIPLPTLQAISQNTAICLGGKTTLNANGAFNYTWSPSAGLIDPFANFIEVSPQATTIYTLQGSNGLCAASLNIKIDVIPNPVINLTANSQKICQGSTATIFANGASAYTWTPNSNINFVTPNIGIVSPSVTTNYTVLGYNFSGTLGCSMTQEITIEVVSQVTANVSNSVSICEGESVRLVSSGRNTYFWTPTIGLNNPNISSPYANPTTTTIYTVNVSDGGYCGATATVLVKVGPKPTVYAGPDQTINSDEPMYLNASGTGTLTWIFGEGILCKDCPNSQIITQNSGNYIIEAVNASGCKAKDEVFIEVTKDYAIYIPNVFTPNFDGVNDVFMVYGTGIVKIEMNIFDRWGEKLFVSDDQLKGWDGTYKGENSKEDVYTYLINYTSLDNKKHTRTGHVTLMK